MGGDVALLNIMVTSLIGFGCLTAYIFFLVTLEKSLKAISPENRKMKPNVVWVLLIPIVNGILLFFIVKDMATGFRREFDRYAVFKQGKPTYALGVSLAALLCAYYVTNVMIATFLLTGILAWAIIIVFIVYWVQVNKVKNELARLKTTFNLEPGEQSIFI